MIQPITSHQKKRKEKVEGDALAGQWHRMLLFAVAHGPRPNIPTRAAAHHSIPAITNPRAHERARRSSPGRSHVRCECIDLCKLVGLSLGRYIGEANSSFAPETNMPFHRKASGRDTKRPAQSKSLFKRACNGGKSIYYAIVVKEGTSVNKPVWPIHASTSYHYYIQPY